MADTREGGFRYTWRGEVYPSVTHILGDGMPKPALIPWAAKITAECAVDDIDEVQRRLEIGGREDAVAFVKNAMNRKRDRAGLYGSAIHEYVENHLNGRPQPPIPEAIHAKVKSAIRFVDDWEPEPLYTEMKVFNLKHKYAGTFDLIAKLKDGRTLLIDWKSGSGVYGDVSLQLAAYRNAELMAYDDGHDEPMPQVDGCAVVHLRPRGYALVPMRADYEIFRTFLAVKRVCHFQEHESRGCVNWAPKTFTPGTMP